MTEEYERSAISRRLVYLSSTTHRKKNAPKMPRHGRISFFCLLRWRRGGKSRLQRSPYTGPTARKDAEEKERTRRVEVLGAMLVHTPTPMGKILKDKPGSIQLSVAGRRASTLRSRVRAVRRYLNWLALNHDVSYPRELEHVTGYLQARQSEPCTRNALREPHTAIAFLEEVAGAEATSKFTASQVHSIIQQAIRFQGKLRSKRQGCWW